MSRKTAARRRRPRGLRLRPGFFALPGFGYLLAFAAYPMFQLALMSVSRVDSSDILSRWPPAGLANFRGTLRTGEVGTAVVNTLVIVAVLLVVGLGVGTIAALAMVPRTAWVTVTLSIMMFVWALPAVVAGNLWRFLLERDGIINGVLKDLHLVSKPVPWLVNDHLALLSIAAASAWMVLPFSVLIVRAALFEVPTDLLEAALLDGAGPLRRFGTVTLRCIAPTLGVIGVLMVVNGFRTFDLIYVMTKGGPGVATVTLPFLSYRQAFQEFQFGAGAATAILSVGLVLVVAAAYGVLSARKVTT